jgi:hypothetical protein
LKRVTAENLARLSPERLAEILISEAEGQPEFKRRLKMELAAEQGADHLSAEIDKRLAALEASRTKVSWRRRAVFVRDLDLLRGLIAGRLAGLDRTAALDRMWTFIGLARALERRVRDKDGEMATIFVQAASDVGGLLSESTQAPAFSDAIMKNPQGWQVWLAQVLPQAPVSLTRTVLATLLERRGSVPGWVGLVRQLADAAGDVDAYASTFGERALEEPGCAADIARRLLAAGRIEEAGGILQAVLQRRASDGVRAGRVIKTAQRAEPDFDWETVWIDYLEQSGDAAAAQTTRWSSFERTLSPERAKAFVRRLADFDDVEAEARAFDFAALHPDFRRGLRFLMSWPALAEANRMILSRPDDVQASPDEAETWASNLIGRHPEAALLLLRKVAATAFRRRDFVNCDRLSAAANAIDA